MSENYLDKICPYCKSSFTPQDTVVVCSVCDMPHHLSCWQDNQGCATFGWTGWFGWKNGLYHYPAYGANGTLWLEFSDINGNRLGSSSVYITG